MVWDSKTYPLEVAVDHLLAVQIDHAPSNASQLQMLTSSGCQMVTIMDFDRSTHKPQSIRVNVCPRELIHITIRHPF